MARFQRVQRALRLLRPMLTLALVAAAIALGIWLKFLAPVKVIKHTLTRAPLVEEVFGRGTIESQREAAVGFDLVGRLREVSVEEGARVTLGQELARLETDQARADLRSAQTGISAARASLQRLSAEESRVRALLATAERESARIQTLFATGTVTAQQRDESADRVRLAHADLDRVLAQRSEATRGIDVAAGGAEQRRITVVRATLLAPFDGVVTRRVREPGDTVSLGSTVLRIADTSQVYVSAAIDETALSKLAVDQRASISFAQSDETLPGRVTRIGWEADRQTHELLVEVTPDALTRRIAIGQRADVHIEVTRVPDALQLPIAWLQHDTEGAWVYVDRGGRVAVVRPRFGLTSRTHVQILEGLNANDVVLTPTTPASNLAVGRRWVTQ